MSPTVEALLDAVADHPRRLPDAFPGTPAGGWERVRADFPDTVGRDDHWRLPVFSYLIHAYGRTVLVDTGVGPAGSVASDWLGVTGSIGERADVDLVVFTHLHQDHVGWGRAAFPNARFVVSEREWAANGRSRHVEAAFGTTALETTAPGELTPGVELVALYGHTPGHCGVRVGDVLLTGDTFNHPLQLREPDIPSGADADRVQAARTRREVLGQLGPGTRLGGAHLPDGWWTPPS